MGGTGLNFFNIQELEHYTLANCPGYSPGFFPRVLVVARLLPLFITVGFLAIGTVRRELYILMLGLGLTADLWVNYTLVHIIADPVPHPGCGPYAYGMPSTGVEQVIFLYNMIVTYHALWKRYMNWSYRLAITMLPGLTVLANLYLGYHTPMQLCLAAFVGTVDAALWQAAMYYLVIPNAPYILATRLVRPFGYKNKLCAPQGRKRARAHER